MNILTYAAIDIGSNAVRLLINTIYESTEKTIFNKTNLVRLPIRLGEDVFFKGKISTRNINRLCQAMKAYQLIMEVYGVSKYKAFATSAMRDAGNAKEVIKKIKEKSDISVDIISGDQEAKIILQTQLSKILDPSKHYLYVDVGGGSAEVSLLYNGKIEASRSFDIGTVRFLAGKVTDNYLQNEIKPWVKEICKGKEIDLLGSGGNINYIYKLSGKKEGSYLSSTFLYSELEKMKSLTYEERIQQYNMKPDRADVVLPALKIFYSIMHWAKAKRIYIPKIGAADGMISLMYQENKNK